MKYEIALVDDHQLFTKSLEMLLNGLQNFKVTLTAQDGAALQSKIRSICRLPDIMLLDVSMPGMGGAEVASWMTQHYPQVKLAAVTTNDEDKIILSMIKAGCCSYMLKSIHPTELEKALLEIAEKGYYNADITNINNNMSYTLTSLSTKADCTALLTIATREKDEMVYKKTGLQRQSQNATLTAMEIAASLAAVTAELAALDSILVNLPPGPTYDENAVRKTKAEYKKFLLEQRSSNYGPIALVEKEYDMACLDQTIAETDAFIAALEVRRDELPL